HVQSDRARIAQGHVVIAGGLVRVDIHASAGIVWHRAVGPRRVRKGIDPGARIAPVEIAWRCRDLPQRIILRDPVEEQGQRRPSSYGTLFAGLVGGIESSSQPADLPEPRGGVDEDRAAAVAAGSRAFQCRSWYRQVEEVELRDEPALTERVCWIPKLGLEERLGTARGDQLWGYQNVSAQFHCLFPPPVVDRIAAHGAGSVHPIAGGDQHRPRRRDHASDRDRTDGRDWLGERDDGNVICSEKRSVYRGEIWVPDETGD